jgi:N-acetylglucosamine-6-phosphate deacetylase
LAGSAQPLIAGVAHLVRSGLASLDVAWAAASTRPAALLDLPVRAGLAAGAPADLVLFRWDGREIDVERVYKAGELVYAREGRGASG